MILLERLKQFFGQFFRPATKELSALPNLKSSNKTKGLWGDANLSQNLQISFSNAHQTPITNRIKVWMSEQNWRYEHHEPKENTARIHHLILGFTDKNNRDWTCIFRINETNQLVTLFGTIDEYLPTYRYAQAMVEISQVNLNLGYGNLELDTRDGEIRAKISFDGEFTSISDRGLNCYFQSIAGLVDVIYDIVENTKQNTTLSNNVNDYLELTDEVDVVVNDQHQKFFVATTAKQ